MKLPISDLSASAMNTNESSTWDGEPLIINSLSDDSAAAASVKSSLLNAQRADIAPAVTMPFTLAQMHAAAEQNGLLEKSKKRVRQRVSFFLCMCMFLVPLT